MFFSHSCYFYESRYIQGDLLTKIKDGFETMEASQEVAFRAFYNAQKKIRSSSPTRTE